MIFFLRPILVLYIFFLNDKTIPFAHLSAIVNDNKKLWKWGNFVITCLRYYRVNKKFSPAQRIALRRIYKNG